MSHGATSLHSPRGRTFGPTSIAGLLAVFAAGFTAFCLSRYVPASRWIELLSPASRDDIPLLVAQYALLPRCFVSLLAGAMLGGAGVILQHVLRNPLADPTTLGVSAGASLSLAVVSLWFPSLLIYGRQWVALAGALIALGIVMGISWHRSFSPIGVILGGLLVTLSVGAATSVLMLFYGESLTSVFVWQTGNLFQSGWTVTLHLLVESAVAAALAALLIRPVEMLDLGDEGMRSVGLRPGTVRMTALLLASILTAAVVSSVGVIGFIGLVGPWLARLSGARTLRQRLVWGPVVSACLLWFADSVVQTFGSAGSELPTGSVTALFGAPLLIWMMLRVGEKVPAAAPREAAIARAARRHEALWMPAGVLALVALVLVAASFNRSLAGWSWAAWAHVEALLPLRAPRIGGAAVAGGMLGIAGVLMQRMTGNPMASPEILGISSGASLAMIALMFLLPGAGQGIQMAASSVGAIVALLGIFAILAGGRFSEERLVLTGVAITTVLGSLVSLLMAVGDPRMAFLAEWMSGSTYGVQPHAALLGLALLAAAAAVIPFVARPLDIMTLGEQVASSVGLPVRRYRIVVLVMGAITTGAATVVVGPVSFVGLMAPHMARLLGFRHVMLQASGAAIMGAILLVLADWLGRNLLFPAQIPAGLLVMFVGGIYFLFLMWKQT